MMPLRLAALGLLIAAFSFAAAQPPRPLQKLGYDDYKLGDLSDKSIIVRRVEIDTERSTRSRIRFTEVDYTHDLAPEALFRRQELPRGADGKARQYTNEEYTRLREPAGAPGFKAERADFRSGQIVRVWFAREAPRERAVVSTVMLLRDGGDTPRKADDKKKTDDKKKDDKKKDGKKDPP